MTHDAYLYLLLDVNNNTELPLYVQVNAFCEGYFTGLDRCTERGRSAITNQYLNLTGQVQEIIMDVRKSGGQFIDHRNPFQSLARSIRGKYGSRATSGEYPDNAPLLTNAYNIQRAFISGYQTALYAKGVSEEVPMEFGPIRLESYDQTIATISKAAAKLLDTLNEA